MIRSAQAYVGGMVQAPAIVLSAPLSFWGGIDVATGRIIDHSHPDLGKEVAGRILVMPGARGSSSSSSVLAETIRRRTGPLGIILARPDPILTVGAIVALSLYGLSCPIVVCQIEGMRSGDHLVISAAGTGAATIASVESTG